MRPRTSFLASGALLVCHALAPLPGGSSLGWGQTPELAGVESHMAAARFAEARAALERWWDGEPSAPRDERQHALWLRARLTVDPAMAELDYRRLVVEYPGGPWSDDALLRLAQGAEFRGEASDARRYLEILVRDYPDSPHRVEARDRLRRLEEVPDAAPSPSAPEAAPPDRTASLPDPDVAPPARTPSLPDPEDAAPSPPATDEGPDDPTPPVGADDGEFTLQLGAFSSHEGARRLSAAARDAGVDVRIVQVEGSPFFRVRTGAYPTRGEAGLAAERLQELGFDSVVSGDRHREAPGG